MLWHEPKRAVQSIHPGRSTDCISFVVLYSCASSMSSYRQTGGPTSLPKGFSCNIKTSKGTASEIKNWEHGENLNCNGSKHNGANTNMTSNKGQSNGKKRHASRIIIYLCEREGKERREWITRGLFQAVWLIRKSPKSIMCYGRGMGALIQWECNYTAHGVL